MFQVFSAKTPMKTWRVCTRVKRQPSPTQCNLKLNSSNHSGVQSIPPLPISSHPPVLTVLMEAPLLSVLLRPHLLHLLLSDHNHLARSSLSRRLQGNKNSTFDSLTIPVPTSHTTRLSPYLHNWTHHQRHLGSQHYHLRLPSGVYKVASSRTGQPYIIRSDPGGGNPDSHSERGYPEGAIRGCPRRFLLPILSGSKEGRGPSSHPRSEKPQQVSQGTQVQDGDLRVHHPSSQAGRLVCGPGSQRRIFPCHHTQEPQEISASTLQQHHLSVCGLTLRPFHSTQDFHQVHGSGGSIPPPSRDPGVSLHRRLADCLDVQTSGLKGHSVCSPDVTVTRSYRQSRKVQAESVSGGGLHRSEVRFSTRSDVHAPRMHPEASKSHKKVQAKGKSKSKPCTTSARPHGFHNGDPVPCSPQDAFTSNLDAVPLQSTPRQSKQAPHCHPGVGTAAAMVDFLTSPFGGASFPPCPSDNSSHYRRESTGMGHPL
ncbi:uncharacterized protein LOC144588486 [Pogona vitticeps]